MTRSVSRGFVLPFVALGAGLIGAATASAAIPGASGNGLPCGGTVLVETGDTLAEIASFCGVTVDAIVTVNESLNGPNDLRAGESLTIPGAVPVSEASAADLEELLAPIALYPDALLAEMLTAATYPLEIVQAHRWLQENGPDADVSGQDWAPSVQAMTRYPEVLAIMSSDLDWSIQLGDAFLGNPEGVFDTIQTLRARAQDAGNLADNDKQRVIVEPVTAAAELDNDRVVEVVEPVVETRTIIRIVPRYETLYVPTYHPRWVYYPRSYYSSFYYDPIITFGLGYAVGSWLTHYPDWRYGYVRLTPFHYRYPRYFYGSRLHYSFNTRYWTPWVHHPVHRRGYRYANVPRVRVNQGQRHLVNVVPRNNSRVAVRGGARGGSRIATADYRQRERNAALNRSATARGRAAGTGGRIRPSAASSGDISRRLASSGQRGTAGRARGANTATRGASVGTVRNAGTPRADGNTRSRSTTDNRARRANRLDENPASRQSYSGSRGTNRLASSGSSRARSATTTSRNQATTNARNRFVARADQNARSDRSRRAANGTVVRQRPTTNASRSGNVARQRSTVSAPRSTSNARRGTVVRERYTNSSRRSTPSATPQRNTNRYRAAPNSRPSAARQSAPSRSAAPRRQAAPSRSAAPRRQAAPRAPAQRSAPAPRSQSRSSSSGRQRGGGQRRRR
ncbi:MAG: DUF3300 domain-containing protein [Pseudomonadota bacterium]